MLLLIGGATMLAGCTADMNDQSSETVAPEVEPIDLRDTSSDSSTSSSAISTTASRSLLDCVSPSSLGRAMPDDLVFQRPMPWVGREAGWIFNESLATNVPLSGVLGAIRNDGGQLEMKFPWWKRRPGRLTIRAASPGGGAPITGEPAEGYDESSVDFQPSRLIFSESGCWLITGSVGASELSFHLFVCEASSSLATEAELRACGASS